MADPRYRKGVYVGTRRKEEMTRQQHQALAECNPLNFGWALAYRNTTHDLAVYTLAHFKMMYHPDPEKDGWIVEDTTTMQRHFHEGSMTTITAKIKAQLPIPIADEGMVKSNLVALKARFNGNPPTTPAPVTPPAPRPFPKVTLKPETVASLERKAETDRAKATAGETALRVALAPDHINRTGNFNRVWRRR